MYSDTDVSFNKNEPKILLKLKLKKFRFHLVGNTGSATHAQSHWPILSKQMEAAKF